MQTSSIYHAHVTTSVPHSTLHLATLVFCWLHSIQQSQWLQMLRLAFSDDNDKHLLHMSSRSVPVLLEL